MADGQSTSPLATQDEDEYVVIDFGGTEEKPSVNKPYRLIGLDTQHPWMQIEGQIFRGTWATAVGTDLHFDGDGNFVAKSTRRLIMRRVPARLKGAPVRRPAEIVIRAEAVDVGSEEQTGEQTKTRPSAHQQPQKPPNAKLQAVPSEADISMNDA
ncbi:hypothetical protein PYCC9005_000148 [Savitreella phatthalungensis]